MLITKHLEDGRTRHSTKTLLIDASDAYLPPQMDFKTSTSVWLSNELIKKRVRDWRRLTDEDGHSGLRSILRKDSVFTGTYSVFPIPLVEWILARYTQKPHSKVLDAFAGGPPRAIATSLMKHHYYGVEIREEQIEENLAVIKSLKLKNINYIQGDGRYLEFDETDFDIALTCPPYWNVEVYSDHKDDISNFPTYESFDAAMQMSAWAHAPKIKSGGFVCIVVANFRDKKTGAMIDFRGHTVENYIDAGFQFWQDIIIMNNFGSAAKRASNAWRGKKLVVIHQHLLVFKQP